MIVQSNYNSIRGSNGIAARIIDIFVSPEYKGFFKKALKSSNTFLQDLLNRMLKVFHTFQSFL